MALFFFCLKIEYLVCTNAPLSLLSKKKEKKKKKKMKKKENREGEQTNKQKSSVILESPCFFSDKSISNKI